MKKNLIVRIGEGLGNQLFMYANAYSLSKKFNYILYIDNESGFSKNRRSRTYNLDIFNIPELICPNKLKFNNPIKNLKRKTFKFIDNFTQKKDLLLKELIRINRLNLKKFLN